MTIDIPGFLAPEASMAPLRWYLRWLGHDARPWGLGTNRGNPEDLRFTFIDVLEDQVAEAGQAANLVAWSMGGVVAREVARMRPDLVQQVVCYGSPLIGGPKYTAGHSRLPPSELERIETLQRELDESDPVQRPVTSIFSRRDGIVDWRASLDHYSAQTEHVEVRSSHVGLGVDPDVWLAVAEALAREP